MNIFSCFEIAFKNIVTELTADNLLPQNLDTSRVVFELPREEKHGDIATNAAMVMAKQTGTAPRDLAALFAQKLNDVDGVTNIEIAGPGFLNIRVEPSLWTREITNILAAKNSYGKKDIGAGASVNIEFVSANPTGPLHAAHARGAVFGDALAGLMEFCGWNVTREYYINDAGGQVDVLAQSTYLRYCEALGQDIGEIPSGLYPGVYLKEVGDALMARDGDMYLNKPENEWLSEVRAFAIDWIMQGIKSDLQKLGIKMDRFSSERDLVNSGAVQHAIDKLQKSGHLYQGVLQPPKGKEPEGWEPRKQLLFKASTFGDDTDRPLQKSDGSWTYFAADVAYHLDKLERTGGQLINIFGADHGGYVKRMTAAVNALSSMPNMLDIKICQLVNLLDDGKPVKMSKRAGTFVTVEDVVRSVGEDVIRFIMLTRRNDQTLDFDLAKVTEQSRDNPIFYVQYAHARACSVIRQFEKDMPSSELVNLDLLTDPAELALVKILVSWPKLVASAASAHEPHRIAFYLLDLASAFHSLWNAGRENPSLRFIINRDEEITAARLQLVKATSFIICTGLNVLSIEALNEM
ncbi:arginine--tRNA ligase [Candidatus Puniceispirillum sp.]|nr:arginine--tRNA ligase [Candidatus Puniceispirillum sp.]